MISTETFPSSGPPTPGAAFFTATKQKAEGMSLLRTSSKESKAFFAPRCSGATVDGNNVNLTVRTLDKREHQLSVAHDISVRELKDAVAMITSIDAESQRLVSGGDEMSLDARLSDYCKAKSHVIYLVVRFPGVSYADSPQENDLEDAEVETGESSATTSEVSTRANPRIVLRGTVTIPVPERDMHRVMHSLLGSQTNLSEFVSSMASDEERQSWNRARRGGAARPRMQRGRQTQMRRGLAQRAGGNRPERQRNSVNMTFRGSEWESLRMWPQSIDFRQAGLGDHLEFDSVDDTSSSGAFRLHYSSSAHRRIASTHSDGSDSAGGGALSSQLECDDSEDHVIDNSYLSANQTLLANDAISGDTYLEPHLDVINYSGGSMIDEEEWDENEHQVDYYSALRMGHNELPLGRMTGKRKYAEMGSNPVNPNRSAPRSRNMPLDMSPALCLQAPSVSEYSRRVVCSTAEGEDDECDVYEEHGETSEGATNSASNSASLSSPSHSNLLDSPPEGACPDINPFSAPLSMRMAPVCQYELPPGSAMQQAASRQASTRSLSTPHTHLSLDPLAADEVEGMSCNMGSLSLMPQPADKGAAIKESSQAHVVDVSSASRAVYKTHPPLLGEVLPAVSQQGGSSPGTALSPGASSAGSVLSHRNSTDPNSIDAYHKPVKKNQCCVVM